MSKKSRFRESFDKQHGKRAPALLKSASLHLYDISWSVLSRLSWKTSLLLTYQILGLLVNTLAADEKYPVLITDKLTRPYQMELYQKQKNFLIFLLYFWNLDEIFNTLTKEMIFIDFVILKTSLLLTCYFLGMLVNTLAADKKYRVLNRDNLTIPIQMQLSQKQKNFAQFFAAFLKSTINFKSYEKKDDAHRFCVYELTDSVNVVR